jgi:PAS domain S-box-containing protein
MIYTGLVAVSIGITCLLFLHFNKRKKFKELSMIEEHFRDLINDLNVAVYIIQNISIVLTNHEGAHIAGSSIESIIGYPLDYLFSEYTVINDKELHYSSFTDLSNMVQAGPMVYRARWKRKDGTVLDVLFRIRHVQWMGNSALECIVNDTTDINRLLVEREKLKGQLLQSQKLEIVGQITGGIAHDFNNILTVILGYANLLEASVDAKNREAVTKIIEAGNHARDIVSKMLTFARKKVFLEQKMHLHHIIQNGILLLKTALPKSCTVDMQLHATVDTIVGDTTQIQQMLMNLVINASEAMPEGGTINIETTNVTIEHERIGKVETIHAGEYILLSIKDSGIGIAEKDIEHIFEPLFTTKEKGSGFGLSIVYGIVKQHKGYIDVVSIPGKGSTFYIYLPVINKNRVEASLKIIDNKKESLPALGGEIVIIDDDANIGSLYKESLHLAGLHAVTFTNAEEMFDYIRTHAITVKLIISDVRMPGISGEQVLEYIKQHYPEIPVVMISGYYDENMRELLIEKGAKDVWEKMYKIDEIKKRLNVY